MGSEMASFRIFPDSGTSEGVLALFFRKPRIIARLFRLFLLKRRDLPVFERAFLRGFGCR
jgi:hypothetical protein